MRTCCLAKLGWAVWICGCGAWVPQPVDPPPEPEPEPGGAAETTHVLEEVVAEPPPPPPAEEPPPTVEEPNIAPTVLPGEWDVLGQPVVFTFDARGIPVAIRNEENPSDFRTNVQFDESRRMSIPLGSLDASLSPGEPFIDRWTGESHFAASATGSNIIVLFIPLPGTGTATYDFNGWYDPVNQELHGVSQFAITYNGLLIYADRVDEYVLKKRTAP